MYRLQCTGCSGTSCCICIVESVAAVGAAAWHFLVVQFAGAGRPSAGIGRTAGILSAAHHSQFCSFASAGVIAACLCVHCANIAAVEGLIGGIFGQPCGRLEAPADVREWLVHQGLIMLQVSCSAVACMPPRVAVTRNSDKLMQLQLAEPARQCIVCVLILLS